MHGKRGLDRASYDTDIEFERAVDAAASPLGTDEQLRLMLSLMRECRGCGTEVVPGSVEIQTAARTQASWLTCKSCEHRVPLPLSGQISLGRVVTLWNQTPLTIEAEVAHV